MFLDYLLNQILMLSFRPAYLAFQKGLSCIGEKQKKLLFDILHKNSGTVLGKKYNFEKIKTVKQFQKQVPISSYSEMQVYIEQLKEKNEPILTSEKIFLFEPSSGSTGSCKYIPYTKGLKKQFQCGIAPWLYDLYNRHKVLLWGKSYWSITPLTYQKQYSKSGIPIGFEEDSDYFGKLEGFVLDKLFVVPKEIKYVSDMENFRYITLAFLLANDNLRFISVWNPSFLIILLSYMGEYKYKFLDDFDNKTLTPPNIMDEDLKSIFIKKLHISAKRRRILKKLLNENSLNYEAIWEKLTLISMWTDGNAGFYLSKIKELFPNTRIQSKGLLATECFVSFPYKSDFVSSVSYLSHFFEFIPCSADGSLAYENVKLLCELEIGKRYCVVVTTTGGFYRYNLEDIIEIVESDSPLPKIKFIEKSGNISDRVGEKLNESFAGEVITDTFNKSKIEPSFFMLAPELGDDEIYYYVLFLQVTTEIIPVMQHVKNTIEQRLRENIHYDYARQLNQLNPLKIFIINDECNATEIYIEQCRKWGQKLGNIKSVCLDKRSGWNNVFKGDFLK